MDALAAASEAGHGTQKPGLESSSTADGASAAFERRLSASAAAFAGFCVGALVNAALLLGQRSASASERWLLHVVDAAHFVTAGFVAALLVAADRRSGPRRRWAAAVALAVLAAAAGAVLLHDDLENFSERTAERLPPWVVLSAATLAVAAWVPAAFVAGRLFARVRFGRALALAGSVLGFVANALVLPGDYQGVHAYIAWAAAVLAGAALRGVRLPRLALALTPHLPQKRWVGRALVVTAGVAAAGVLCLDPPSGAAVALAQSEGSAFVPFVSELRARLRGEAKLEVVHHDAWFRDRSQEPPVPPSRPALLPDNPIVILLTVDSTRQNVIHSGEFDSRLPNFAKLRDESVAFTQARSAGTFTKLSISSIFMGTYFSQQYWTKAQDRRIYAPHEDTSVRFPELLQKVGVRTVTLLSVPWLTSINGYVRGFDVDERVPQPGSYTASPPMFARMKQELDSIGARPAFFFVHLSDPHNPYDLGGVQGHAFERYLGEVAFVDRGLGDFLRFLDKPELARRTALIVSADHGEAFGEHDSRTHGNTLYDELMRVPLMIRLPGVKPRRVEDMVTLVDLGPTILDLFGVATPGHFLGQSLTPYLRGENPKLTRPILAETRRLKTLITPERFKVIVDESRRKTELYDLRRDPGELKNLADDAALLAEPLSRLRQFYDVHRLRRPGYEPPNVK